MISQTLLQPVTVESPIYDRSQEIPKIYLNIFTFLKSEVNIPQDYLNVSSESFLQAIMLQ